MNGDVPFKPKSTCLIFLLNKLYGKFLNNVDVSKQSTISVDHIYNFMTSISLLKAFPSKDLPANSEHEV